ncbi:hypothetical protein RAF48_09125 [Klebsiella pneumoniae]|nr:hypothetical protein [Klebsiella pneumoniae]
MVDKDSFLNKLNQRAQDEKLAQEKAKIEKQNLHAEANKKSKYTFQESMH